MVVQQQLNTVTQSMAISDAPMVCRAAVRCPRTYDPTMIEPNNPVGHSCAGLVRPEPGRADGSPRPVRKWRDLHVEAQKTRRPDGEEQLSAHGGWHPPSARLASTVRTHGHWRATEYRHRSTSSARKRMNEFTTLPDGRIRRVPRGDGPTALSYSPAERRSPKPANAPVTGRRRVQSRLLRYSCSANAAAFVLNFETTSH